MMTSEVVKDVVALDGSIQGVRVVLPVPIRHVEPVKIMPVATQTSPSSSAKPSGSSPTERSPNIPKLTPSPITSKVRLLGDVSSGKKRKLGQNTVTMGSHDQNGQSSPSRVNEKDARLSGCVKCRKGRDSTGTDSVMPCQECIRFSKAARREVSAIKEVETPEMVQKRQHGKNISFKYKLSVGWKPAPVLWKPPKVKTIECSVFLTCLFLHKFVRESVQRKAYAADAFAGLKFEVISTPKLMKEHLKVLMRGSKISTEEKETLKVLLRKHRALILCFYLQGPSNEFKLDLQSSSPFEISQMYKEQVSRSTENLFLTNICSCGHPSHTPRLTIALKLMNEVIAAATISVFTVHFRGQGKRPMVVLEILGLAVKKGDMMGKGLGRLMISYLRHLAHRMKFDLDVDVGMITKTSNDSAAWWASVSSFYSFREASKKFDKKTKTKWKKVLSNSQSKLHMFYSHFNLSRSYLWAPELDKPSEMESIDVTYMKVLRRIVDVVNCRGAAAFS